MIRLPRWLVLVGFWLPLTVASFAAFLPQGLPMPFRVSDIVLHTFAFTYLTAALWFAHFRDAAWWKSAGWMLAYGVFIEVVQSFEPTRDAELKDIAVDVAGIALGLALYRFVLARLNVPPH
jgi:VanZ family protein